MQILIAIIIFLELLTYIIFIDVILSWLQLVWIRFRPKFVANIIDPLYSKIRKIVPTIFWPFDFTPIIVIIIIVFIKWALFIVFPELTLEINKLTN